MAPHYDLSRELDRAAELLTQADSLLILAGAGMGVDSGLPDYRGDEGLWNRHAAFERVGVPYELASSARMFFQDPELAWGVYGYRLAMYRVAQPHVGFDILLNWTHLLPLPSFVFTSNIDGQFQKAGFPEARIEECHGSIHSLQCSQRCTQTVWSSRNVQPTIDESTFRWHGELPRCIYCDALARPNILMFHDAHWATLKAEQQAEQFKRWRLSVQSPVAIEIGAGPEVPRVRNLSNAFSRRLIRINPRDCEVRSHEVGLRVSAAEALSRLANLITGAPGS